MSGARTARILEEFKHIVKEYAVKRIEDYIENTSLDDVLDKTDADLDDLLYDTFDTFVEETFNGDVNEFTHYSADDLNDINSTQAFTLLGLGAKYYKDEFDIQIDLSNPYKIWDFLAYWIVKEELFEDLFETFDTEIRNKIKSLIAEREEAEEQEDTDGKRLLECGICLEPKLIHVCCASCKGKYLCKSCYNKVDNECPFCRGMMIYNHLTFRFFEKVENIPNQTCRCVVYRKSDEKEAFFRKLWSDVLPEIRKPNENFGYKNINKSIPRGQDFQNWVNKMIKVNYRFR